MKEFSETEEGKDQFTILRDVMQSWCIGTKTRPTKEELTLCVEHALEIGLNEGFKAGIKKHIFSCLCDECRTAFHEKINQARKEEHDRWVQRVGYDIDNKDAEEALKKNEAKK